MVPERGSSYRESGVNVDANNEANQRIGAIAKQTYTKRVITAHGLFGGGVSLQKEELSFKLCATGTSLNPSGIPSPGFPHSKSYIPLGVVDYLAATPLMPGQVEDVVRGLSRSCIEIKVPLVGGETAEMPGVIKSGQMERRSHYYYLDCLKDSSFNLNSLQEPVLILSMDGVGTKTALYSKEEDLQGFVLDIINHSRGDILCMGARALGMCLFIGYHPSLALNIETLKEDIHTLFEKQGLELFHLAFEPNSRIYEKDRLDICGSVAGILDVKTLLGSHNIEVGSELLALPSNGLHTNGYSLARMALRECLYDQEVSSMLKVPHRDYSGFVLPLLESGDIQAIAHITGGGIKENLVRILKEGVFARVNLDKIQRPQIFDLIQKEGSIPFSDETNRGMLETFNLGVGMILVLKKGSLSRIQQKLEALGLPSYPCGEILEGDMKVEVSI